MEIVTLIGGIVGLAAAIVFFTFLIRSVLRVQETQQKLDMQVLLLSRIAEKLGVEKEKIMAIIRELE